MAKAQLDERRGVFEKDEDGKCEYLGLVWFALEQTYTIHAKGFDSLQKFNNLAKKFTEIADKEEPEPPMVRCPSCGTQMPVNIPGLTQQAEYVLNNDKEVVTLSSDRFTLFQSVVKNDNIVWPFDKRERAEEFITWCGNWEKVEEKKEDAKPETK